jgi:ribosomal peptide maturation radical SAM protein 1
MPFAPLERPSLALSLLKALALGAGHACDVAYLSLAFAARLGREPYELITDGLPHCALAGEWVFAGDLHGDDGSPESYVDAVLRSRWGVDGASVAAVIHAREEATGFLDDCVASVSWADYDVVGFTSICAQNTASLALARRLKQRWPHLVVVFGGHNWSGQMGSELLAQNPWVDFAFSGEADEGFARLLTSLASGEDPGAARIPGLMVRGAQGVETVLGAQCLDLDGLPVPCHEDYFEWLSRYDFTPAVSPVVPVETSRGCWWGAREPCAFCGLNGPARGYRTKSPARILSELRELAVLPAARLDVVDNVVSPRFLAEVVPELASLSPSVALSLKVRPDLPREHVRALGAAGVAVKAGLESLDDHVLTLLHKGTSRLQNVRLLRWCREAGVPVAWNFLSGVPGEALVDYLEMCELVPLISFLEPPDVFASIVLERFSPYFGCPERHGMGRPRPSVAYRYVYPYPDESLDRLAYFFDHDYVPDIAVLLGVARLKDRIARWQRKGGTGALRAHTQPDGRLVVRDSREGEPAESAVLDPIERALLVACDDVRDGATLPAAVAAACDDAGDPEALVAQALPSLLARGYLLRDGERYLSLVSLA